MSYTSEYTGGQKNNATIEKGMTIDKREAISNGYIINHIFLYFTNGDG